LNALRVGLAADVGYSSLDLDLVERGGLEVV
jgi:hypothetical protein